jgi:hypothetical protein
LGEWAVTSGSRGRRLVAADFLVFIRKLIFLTADFGCVKKKCAHPKHMSLCPFFVGKAVTPGL